VRTPQRERSRATRYRLLEATVDCLVEHGWCGTTTVLIAQKAGVSRGAQLHHFPTKATLVLAAVEHLAGRRAEEIRAEAGTPPYQVDRVVQLLSTAFTGPLYVAALEVWVAGRTDPALRQALVPLEARVGRELHRLAVDLLGADDTDPPVREAVQATLDLLRGLGVASLLSDDTPRRQAILAAWTRQLADILRSTRG
jgi:AcrR family transcriptional regulator